MNVGFIGLGVMGQGMAAQLLDHGHVLTVYNRTRQRATPLEQKGARVAATPGACAEGAGVVITMVSNDAALHGVTEGDDGVLAALRPGTVVLQMSTVGPDTTAWLDGAVRERGGTMLDAPVAGSKPEAEAGRLWIFAGGDEAVIERARPVLDSMSQEVYHIGPLGSATRLKLAFNMAVGGIVAAVSESVALIEASGVDPRLWIKILGDANSGTRITTGKATLMVDEDYAARFSLDNMAKDVGLALTLAQAQGLRLPRAEGTLETLRRAAEIVGGDKDIAAVVEVARRH